MKSTKFLTRAEYPGGKTALSKYIKENLRYPKEALSKNIQGKVFLKYEVNEKGIIHGVFIINSLGYGCDEEAIRLVKTLKYPEIKNRGIKVNTKFKIKINFELPKNESIRFNYVYKPKR